MYVCLHGRVCERECVCVFACVRVHQEEREEAERLSASSSACGVAPSFTCRMAEASLATDCFAVAVEWKMGPSFKGPCLWLRCARR